MYSNTGYLRNDDVDYEDRVRPLVINSCGLYRLIGGTTVSSTFRPQGRKDYQLLYVASGCAYFFYQEKTIKVSAGNMILYRPGECQKYIYHPEDCPEVYWIHFTGRDAEELVTRSGFADPFPRYCSDGYNYGELFGKMILELQMKRPFCEDLLASLMRLLLDTIRRSRAETISGRNHNLKEIEEALRYFNEAFSEEICIEEYAHAHHMSVCWFIRSFKRYMGISPLQYITTVRINKARELLRGTDYSIQEISKMAGYENPLYFSRIFRKTTGVSPKQYRERHGFREDTTS